jgi:hypothetical protein
MGLKHGWEGDGRMDGHVGRYVAHCSHGMNLHIKYLFPIPFAQYPHAPAPSAYPPAYPS